MTKRKTKKINREITFQQFQNKLSKIINSKNAIEIKKENLEQLFIQYTNNNKFNKYYSQFKPFGKDIRGKSGAIVGLYTGKDKMVGKFNKYPRNQKLIKINNDCLNIHFTYNEILINTILKAPKLFNNKITDNENQLLTKHILKNYDNGIGNNDIFIITPQIGLMKNNEYYTNFKNILLKNHIPLIKENPNMTIYYDTFITDLFTNYLKTLNILQKKIGYVNTDHKSANIFIKKIIPNNNKINNTLKKEGFIIDIRLLISDLDKAIVNLPRFKTSINTSAFKKKLSMKLIKNTRYTCEKNIQCDKYTMYDLDILSIFTEILILFHKNNINNMPKFLSLFMKCLNMSDKDFKILEKIIKNSIIIKKAKNIRLPHIYFIVGKFCKYIK